MGALHVCPLSKLDATLAVSGARSVVTLLRRGDAAIRVPTGVTHLWIDINDIAQPIAQHRLAECAHIEALLGFARNWDRLAPALLHCYAGVSRSTAAAFVVACVLAPEADEAMLALRLRQASPTATPNARIVALADQILGRAGRMIAAISAIGRGADCFEGAPFRLDVGGQIPAYQS